MRKLSEARAWRILAEEHDAGRTSSQFLCLSLTITQPANESIPSAVREAMLRRIDANLLPGKITAYGGGDPVELREARVLACLMFAQQAGDHDNV